MQHIAIIGAGQAGFSLADSLRKHGFDGNITLIGEEKSPPYQRPPLSKKYLQGDFTQERLYLRPESFYNQENIALRLGVHVNAIDPKQKCLSIQGKTLSYDMLALTTGAKPHHLPDSLGGNLAGVHVLRTIDDIDHIGKYFHTGRRLLIVGGGYIGLEMAAMAAMAGLDVTLIEMTQRILQRVSSKETSDYFRTLHKNHGVNIQENTRLEKLIGDTHVQSARLTNGQEIKVDFVVIGMGVFPETALAHQAGLAVENGIIVDAFGQTSDPSIWAAGDCASFPYQGHHIRLESVPHAIDQAENIAKNMLGAKEPYQARPWFWSDQYDIKLQIAGLNHGYDQTITRPGKGNALSVWYYKQDRLLAVDAMNDPQAYMVGKRLLEAEKSPLMADILNTDYALKDILKACG